MSGFPILDLILGVIFIYFLLSIICSSVVEIIMTVKRTRAQVLSRWLLRIFDQETKPLLDAEGKEVKDETGKTKMVVLGQEIMDHCALTALSKNGSAPSYIDAKNFTTALLDKIINHSAEKAPKVIDDIIKSLETTTVLSGELKQTFLLQAREAKETFDAMTQKTLGAMEMFRNRMENWYDTNMDRISGTMKKDHTRWFTIFTAIAVALLLNADTIAISKYLYHNDEARERIAARAMATGQDSTVKARIENLRNSIPGNDTTKINDLNTLQGAFDSTTKVLNSAHAALKESIPIGWNKEEFFGIKDVGDGLLFGFLKVLGLALTTLAIMMGTPFWFDVLNKVSNLRGTGPKPASTTDSNFNKPN